jgi:hypothetical protein
VKPAHRNVNLATLSELHGILYEIEEDLTHPRGVSDNDLGHIRQDRA